MFVGGALIGTLISCWGFIKGFGWQILSVILRREKVNPDIAKIIAKYLEKHYGLSKFRQRSYYSQIYRIKDLNKDRTTIFEYYGEFNTLFWYDLIPIFISNPKQEEDKTKNHYIYYLRGSIDFLPLLEKATTFYNKSKEISSLNRFFIKKFDKNISHQTPSLGSVDYNFTDSLYKFITEKEENLGFAAKAKVEDLILTKELEEVVKIAELWKQNKDWYNRKSITWKTGWLLWGEPGTGKAQPLSSTIMTPNGPIIMKDLKVGDKVSTPSGKDSVVTDIFPQGEKDIYRIFFSDNSFTDCCEDHLWKVFYKRGQRNKIIDTKTLIKDLRFKDGRRKYSIPMTKPVEFKPQNHIIHPYLMGLMLAEGNFQSSVRLSMSEKEIIEKVQTLLPITYSLKKIEPKKCDYRLSRISRKTQPIITSEIKRLGLNGHLACDKFIPKEYLIDSIENRLLLLQGLMDGDGTVGKGGDVSYSSISKTLIEDVKFLIQSMGGKCTITSRIPTYKYLGEKYNGQLSYTGHISMLKLKEIFTLTRKLDRVIERSKYLPSRFIDRIEFKGRELAQCILIDDPEHLYLTNEFIVTHNTALARAIAKKLDLPIFIFRLAGVTNKQFEEQWTMMRGAAPCIALMEDFDNIFHGRNNITKICSPFSSMMNIDVEDKKIGEDKNKERSMTFGDDLTFDTFINLLDGVEQYDGIFTIITTNTLNKVDSALINRPGRIDKVLNLTYMTTENKYRLVDKILGDMPEVHQTMTEWLNDNPTVQLTPAVLQEKATSLALLHLYKDKS